VVCRRPHLTLVAACGGLDVPNAGATHLPVVAIIMVGCGPLKALLAPLSATLDALIAAVDGGVRRCSLTTA
jgi:hypothetical protein